MIQFKDFIPFRLELLGNVGRAHSGVEDVYESMAAVSDRMNEFCTDDNITVINVETLIIQNVRGVDRPVLTEGRFQTATTGMYPGHNYSSHHFQVIRVWYSVTAPAAGLPSYSNIIPEN
jgi:hypothetical protein